jgi:ABC-type multidrug transport system fused ATPase/permease subunit
MRFILITLYFAALGFACGAEALLPTIRLRGLVLGKILVPAMSKTATQSPSKESTPTTTETAFLQWGRLFDGQGNMPQVEKVSRTASSWVLLIVAKLASLGSPVYFRSLILNLASEEATIGGMLGMVNLGFIIGYGLSRLSSAVVQFISEFILSPVFSSAAAVLPSEAFSAALKYAGRRKGDKKKRDLTVGGVSQVLDAAGGTDEGPSGFARRALDRGLRASNQFIYRSIYSLFPSLIESFFVLFFIFFKLGATVGAVSAAVACLFVFSTTFVMNKRLPILRKQLRDEGVANGYVDDALSSAETVAAFGANSIEEKRYRDALGNVGRSALDVRTSYCLLKLLQALILTLGSVAVIYTACKTSIVSTIPRKELPGQLVLVSSLFAQLCAPLDQVGQQFRDCVAAAEDIRELEGVKRSYLSDQQMYVDRKISPPKVFRQYGGKSQWNGHPPRVEIRNLKFTYNGTVGATPVLRNISLIIQPGGYSIGVVGPSGCGKSTLLRTVLGIENINPNDGSRILIDGIDVTGLDRTSCFSSIGQDTDLFRGLNLVENVCYGTNDGYDPNQAMLALQNAAEDAQLEPVLSRLEKRWQAPVGPQGRLLSGGERQRVCLARALYREEMGASILLMDEATSNLDAQTENLITRAVLKRVDLGATAIIVAHRLSSVKSCNLILVLKDGEIFEQGTHEELSNKEGGWYAEAWRLQSQSSIGERGFIYDGQV